MIGTDHCLPLKKGISHYNENILGNSQQMLKMPNQSNVGGVSAGRQLSEGSVCTKTDFPYQLYSLNFIKMFICKDKVQEVETF